MQPKPVSYFSNAFRIWRPTWDPIQLPWYLKLHKTELGMSNLIKYSQPLFDFFSSAFKKGAQCGTQNRDSEILILMRLK